MKKNILDKKSINRPQINVGDYVYSFDEYINLLGEENTYHPVNGYVEGIDASNLIYCAKNGLTDELEDCEVMYIISDDDGGSCEIRSDEIFTSKKKRDKEIERLQENEANRVKAKLEAKMNYLKKKISAYE